MRSPARAASSLRWIPMTFIVALLVVPQAPALGGGWWSSIDLDRYELITGEPVELSSQVFFDPRSGLDDLERARSGAVTYHAYLLIEWDEAVLDRAMRHDFRPGWWRTPAEILRLGQVTLREGSSNIARARGTFDVPEIEPGRYSIMVCDLGCGRPLGNFIPTRIRIFDADGFAEHLDRRINGVARRSVTDRGRIRKLERRLADARSQDEFADLYTGVLNKRVSGLHERVSELAARPDEAGVSWPWMLVAVLGAGTLSALITRRRTRRAQAPAGREGNAKEREPAGV